MFISYKTQFINLVNCRLFSLSVKCTASKQNFMKVRYKKWATDYALENFDEHYKQTYKSLWPSIRLGLLSQHKYCCFINNYADKEDAVELMESINAENIRTNFNKRFEVIKSQSLGENVDTKSEGKKRRNERLEMELDEEARSAETPTLSNSVGRFVSHDSDKFAYLNQYVPTTKLKGMENWVDESDYFANSGKFFENASYDDAVCEPRPLPASWKVYCFKRSDMSTFPAPKRGLTGLLNYYLMDATSILPVFALDPCPGDSVLDMCSAPGGKSLAILQTLYQLNLVCVDDQLDRAKRLRRVFDAYLPISVKWPTIVVADGRRYKEQTGEFNKILVDAPCTTDRLSVHERENNIFNPTRIKERVRIPSVQAELLSAALHAVKVGGSVVYSTCSLSPVQNDNVVQVALKDVSEKSFARFVVHDMSKLMFPFRFLMRFHQSTKLGQLVVPFLPCNFGPMYICKISKISE